VTRLKPGARRRFGVVIYRLAAISGVCNIWNGDGLRMLVLSMMLFCMDFLVLLEVLRAFEGFFTDLKMR
jgi:hypothetical protein